MYVRKKIRTRNRLIMVAVLVLGFLFWRGLKASTAKTHDCEFKLIYAVCSEKSKDAKMPGLWDIFKSGTEF
jgi:hypothetical protein